MSPFNKEVDFEGLRLLFRRSGKLPQLPGSAVRLLAAIDSGQASARDLERIITCDSALAAALLRLANSAESGFPGGITTIRAAILRLGQRAVRSLGVSLSLQAVLNGDGTASGFSAKRYAQHGIAVGFLSRYVFARRRQTAPFTTSWTPDELFAVGLLHDLGEALLARVSPGVYDLVSSEAQNSGRSLSEAFSEAYGQPLGALGEDAARTWGLPARFLPAIRHVETPCEAADELEALYCLNYADRLAKRAGLKVETWDFDVSVDPLVQSEVGLDEQETAELLNLVQAQTLNYLDASMCFAA